MSDTSPQKWERELLQNLLLETLKEQRRRRRWGIFFKLLGFGFVGALLYLGAGFGGEAKESLTRAPHAAVVTLDGVISAQSQASADVVIEGLRDAFKDHNTKAVILRLNSPGGSPVQAGQINDEIRRLRKLYPQTPLYAVVEDICASGGYYVAVAADQIFVDKASLVGSIGVLMDGFGFTGAMDKLGIERRLIAAGDNKGFLDPFSPVNAQQQQYARTMLAEIHAQFIQVVREGRGQRLKETPEMFSGLIWSGSKSIELGLVDGYGSVESVARDLVKVEDVMDFTPKENFADRLAKTVGASAGTSLGSWLGLKLH
jgi:protease-4